MIHRRQAIKFKYLNIHYERKKKKKEAGRCFRLGRVPSAHANRTRPRIVRESAGTRIYRPVLRARYVSLRGDARVSQSECTSRDDVRTACTSDEREQNNRRGGATTDCALRADRRAAILSRFRLRESNERPRRHSRARLRAAAATATPFPRIFARAPEASRRTGRAARVAGVRGARSAGRRPPGRRVDQRGAAFPDVPMNFQRRRETSSRFDRLSGVRA